MVVFNAGARQTNWFGPIARVGVLDAGLLNCEDVTPGVLGIPLVLLAPCLREKNTYFFITKSKISIFHFRLCYTITNIGQNDKGLLANS